MNPVVLRIAQDLAREMAAEGAAATVLMGSHVRGEAHGESDIDLTFIGRDEDGWLERRAGHLVSAYWRKAETVLAGFDTPAVAGGLVPAWRQALAVHDPQGVALSLKRQAESWQWSAIEETCDRWVAQEIASYAEEVHRLVGCLRTGNLLMAAVVRSVLAMRLATVLSVHLRLFYETENRLWDLVGRTMGERWTLVQARALGSGGEPFQATCAAALELYTVAAAHTTHLMDQTQSRVVAHACALAAQQLDQRPGAER
ncbi:MAG: nucleotidyltransferase domain-containing protein [Candidatus Latescibacterota bacterium]